MLFSLLAQSCSNLFHVSVLVGKNGDPDIQSVQFLDPFDENLSKNAIYFCNYDEYSALCQRGLRDLNFAVFDPEKQIESIQGNNALLCQTHNERGQLFNYIHNQVETNARQQIEFNLVRLFTRDSSDLLDGLKEALGNPVAILDIAGRVLANSSVDRAVLTRFAHTFSRHIDSHSYNAASFSQPTMISFHDDDESYHALVRKISSDHNFPVFLVEFGLQSHVPQYDFDCLEIAAQLLENHFIQKGYPKEWSTLDPAAVALINLLRDRDQSYFSEEQLRSNLFSQSSIWFIAVSKCPEDISEFYKLLHALRTIPQATPFYFRDYVVSVSPYIPNTETKSPYYFTFLGLLENISREYNLPFGLSEPFSGLNNLKAGYLQAQRALEHSLLFEKSFGIFEYDAIRAFISHENASVKEALAEYCHPSLQFLIKYDQQNGTEYFKTLHEFVLNERNLKLSAKNLNIHRNTLSYRLAQITKLLALSVWEPEYYFQLSFSFRLYDYCMRVENQWDNKEKSD